MEERPQIGCVEDLATLTKLDEQILLEELQERYRRDLIYTYVGDILIAVNPFKDIGIYGEKETEKYKNAKKSSNPPHIFAVSDMACQSISGYGGLLPKDQCILISGESGAGKTESTKLIIKQLINLSHGKSQLEQQILQVNPLLEAFGNAQTQMNDNSSRFGKYIQLRFLDGQVKGAKISEYLLEKSRVVGQNEEEENFHIFYYLFAGQRDNNTTNLHLKDPNRFRYLTNGVENFNSKLPHLTKQYQELLNSMDMVGFNDSEQETLFSMIAGILHLGNIKFETDEDNDETLVSNPGGDLQTAANLLDIDVNDLEGGLTSIITVAGGEYMQINYNKTKAADCRDALSKAIYGRLFGWIVNKINQLLAPELLVYQDAYREIGILDIFGFEHFEKNSFEQACINLANEQLQFFFNQHIFKMEQEEYMKEGIDWTEIQFVDNKPLLDMFLTKPVGIISLLDEECQFPKATHLTFVEKLNQNFHKHPNFQKSQQSKQPVFTIHHYAGKVTYDTSQWLEKNRDTLPEGITDIMKSSKNKLIKTLFQAEISRTGTLALQGRKSTRSRNTKSQAPVKVSRDAKRKTTVGTKFKRSLHMLMEKMTKASPIFVRCLKPNHNKRAGEFNNAYIQAQLLYTGMLETTKIRREGFAIRPPFEEFVDRYKILIHKPKLKGTSTNCMEILKSTGLTGWHIGKTKVFLKYWHIEKMADLLVTLGKAATQLQRVVRGFLAIKEFQRRLAERKSAELARLAHIIAQQNAAKAAEQAKLLEMNKTQSKDVIYGRSGVVPRAFPDEKPNGKHNLSIGTQSDVLNSRSMYTQGTQMEDIDSSDSDDVLQDIFVALEENNKYGTPGTKEATLGWFAETQTEQVYDHDAGMFAEWFHGIISRRDSENLLKNKPVGCFLIRVSESRFGYSLSFKVDNRCRHYMIDQLKNGKFVICGESKVHRSLQNMVEHYKKNKISNYDGYLTQPCGQANGECDYTELLNDQVYHVLEESSKQYYKVPPQRREKPSGQAPPALPPPRRSTNLTTEYKVASNPDESRKRLLLNQTQQHQDATIFSTVNRNR